MVRGRRLPQSVRAARALLPAFRAEAGHRYRVVAGGVELDMMLGGTAWHLDLIDETTDKQVAEADDSETCNPFAGRIAPDSPLNE